MEKFRRLKDSLERELESIGNKDLSAGSLAQAETISHTLKCIATYEAMDEESGYSEHYPMYPMRGGYEYGYDDGSSYARGRGRYARRDSRGRYSSEDGHSYDDGRMMEQNSGGESMDSYRRY